MKPLVAKCSKCGSHLFCCLVETEQETVLLVDICRKCADRISHEDYNKGYEDGYHSTVTVH